MAPRILIAFVLLLTYGFEAFNFNLSLDEPLAAWQGKRWAFVWLGQGRWGMAATTALLPTTVIPTVPTVLGVTALAAALYLYATRVLGVREWPATLAVCVAVAHPVLAFSYSFSIISVGIGLGALAVWGFAQALPSMPTWKGAAVAAMVGGFAIGTYESHAVNLVLAIVGVLLFRFDLRWMWRAIVGLLASCLIYVAGRSLGRLALNSEDAYIESFFKEVGGPVGAANRAFSVFAITADTFLVTAPAVWAFLAVSLTAALWRVVRLRSLRSGALLAVVILTPIAVFIASPAAPLRSMLFVPWVWLIVCCWAFGNVSDWRRPGALALAALTLLAAVSHASVANRMFVGGRIAFDNDRAIAHEIERARVSFAPDQTVPVVVSAGAFRRPNSTVAPTVEPLGISMYAAEPFRAASFLQAIGVGVTVPRNAQVEASRPRLESMPTYPQPGWIAYEEGVLLVKLSQ